MEKMSLYGYEKKITALAAGKTRCQMEKRIKMLSGQVKPLYNALPELLFQGWYPYEYTSGSKKVFILRKDREDLGKGVYNEIKLNKSLISFCRYLLENFKSVEECNAYAEEETKKADELARIEAEREAEREREEKEYKCWKAECFRKAEIFSRNHEYDKIDFIVEKFFPNQVGELHWYTIPAMLLELNGENKEYARRALKDRLYRGNPCSKKFLPH